MRRCMNKKWLHNTHILNTKCVSPRVLHSGLKTTGLSLGCFLGKCSRTSRIRDTCSCSPGSTHPSAAVSFPERADSLCLWSLRSQSKPPHHLSSFMQKVRAEPVSASSTNSNRTLCMWSSEKQRGGSREGLNWASAHRGTHDIDLLSQE